MESYYSIEIYCYNDKESKKREEQLDKLLQKMNLKRNSFDMDFVFGRDGENMKLNTNVHITNSKDVMEFINNLPLKYSIQFVYKYANNNSDPQIIFSQNNKIDENNMDNDDKLIYLTIYMFAIKK